MEVEFEHDLFTIAGHPRSGLFNLGSTDILDEIILHCEGLNCVSQDGKQQPLLLLTGYR